MRGRALGVLAVAGSLVLLATLLGSALPVRAASGSRFEINVSNDPSTDNAEPSVAINPTNPANLIVLYIQEPFVAKHDIVHGQLPSPRDVESPLQSVEVAVSHDRGRTWSRRMMPTIDPLHDPIMDNSSDPYIVFGNDGTAYAMTTAYNPAFLLWDELRVSVSRDGGDTWSDPVIAFDNTLDPGSHPIDDLGQGRIRQYGDRPWLAIDSSTGTLYLTGVQTWVQPQGTEGELGYLTSSIDGGQTWSSPVEAAPVGSPIPSAAFGRLAIVYNPPAGASGADACTCVIMALTKDRGRTFVRRHTPATGSSPEIAADPSHPGRFAVLTLTSGDTAVSVWVTDDDGLHWSGPAVISQRPANTRYEPWIAYGRSGVLGAGWRTQYADATYDFWAAAAPHGDTRFDPPVRLSTSASPPIEQPYAAGDDTSDVKIDGTDRLYGAWADWRGGKGENVYLGGFPVLR